MANEKVSLLVVEDNDVDFRLVREHLKDSSQMSFEISRAKLLSEAIKMIGLKSFDAVLLDMGLPDNTGLSNVDKIWKLNSKMAILVLTGMDDEQLGLEAVKRGAQDYLIKGTMSDGMLQRSIRYAMERKQAENKMIHLASFPNNDPDPIIEIDINGQDIFSNKSCIKILDEKGLPQKIEMFFPSDFDQILKTLHSGEKKDFYREISIKGAFFLESISVLPELQVVRIHAHENTKNKRAEITLRQSEERLRRFYESGMVGVFYWNVNGLITDANDKFLMMMGFTREDLISGKLDWKKLVASDCHYADEESVKELKAKGVNKNPVELALIRKDGTRMSVVVARAMLFQESLNGVSFVLDITERKRVENKLRKNEEELKKLNMTFKAISDSNQAMFHADNEEEYLTEVCKNIVEDCGYFMVWIGFADEDEAKTVRPAAHAGFEKGYLETVHVSWADNEHGQGPTGMAIRSGTVRICRNLLTDPCFKPWRQEALKRGYSSSIVFPLANADKVFGAITLYSKDENIFSEKEVRLLSELASDLSNGIMRIRLQAQHANAVEALRASEGKYRNLFMNMSEEVHLWQLDRNEEGWIKTWKLVDANPPTLKSWGKTLEEIKGKTTDEILGPGTTDHYMPIVKKIMAEGVSHYYEDYFPNLDRHFRFTSVPLGDYFITTGADITSIKKAQEVLERDKDVFEKLVNERTEELLNVRLELEKSKRLSDIGVLAATVAHELRNPLAAIAITATNIQRKSKDAATFERHFQSIKRKISESNQIINNLLFYSRLRKPNFQNVEIHRILEECVNLEERKTNGKVVFTRQFDPIKDVLIEADGLQLQEVVSNLLSNARDAIIKGQGVVGITAGHDANAVRVCIKDNGVGIPQECLERIFDPFFTTKSNGTGLGLTVCHQIVTMHKGSIGFTSEPGQGTVVEMVLPKGGNNGK